MLRKVNYMNMTHINMEKTHQDSISYMSGTYMQPKAPKVFNELKLYLN